MGLDMYLYQRYYVSAYNHSSQEEKDRFTDIVKQVDPTLYLGGNRHLHVEVCVGYWRKANAIHKFFCDLDEGRDECQNIYVTEDNLRTLRALCQSVLLEPSIAEQVLPPQTGFFFGSTDVDEWYMQDMKSTIEIIDNVLDRLTPDGYPEFIYRASW
jgi:hypothetical protein